MIQTALILPLEPVDASVEAFRDAHDPAAKLGIPAHITLIFPFIALEDFGAVQDRALEQVMQGCDGFSYELDRVETFDQVAYLAPGSAEPLLALIQTLIRAFPAYPPYGGAHDEIIPHLTVGDKDCAEQARQQIELPVRGLAERALLLRKPEEHWLPHKHFRLCGLA